MGGGHCIHLLLPDMDVSKHFTFVSLLMCCCCVMIIVRFRLYSILYEVVPLF
jgi:hypothetical protein